MAQTEKRYRGKQGRMGYLLRQAQHAVRLRIDQALQELNMTHPQFAVLSILEYEEAPHSADIARISMFSAQATHSIIAKLETRGYITRLPHPTHGRILTIQMTKSGQRLLAQCKKRVYAIETELCAKLSKTEEAIIRKWLVYCTQI